MRYQNSFFSWDWQEMSHSMAGLMWLHTDFWKRGIEQVFYLEETLDTAVVVTRYFQNMAKWYKGRTVSRFRSKFSQALGS